MTRRNSPATGMLRLAAAILFIAGPIVALVFGSWGHVVRGGGYRAWDTACPPRRASQRALPRSSALARRRVHHARRPDTPFVGSITLSERERMRASTLLTEVPIEGKFCELPLY